MSPGAAIPDHQVIAAIRPTKLVQGALEDQRSKSTAEREAMSQRLATITKEQEAARPKRTAAVSAAVAEYRRLEASLHEAKNKVIAAEIARSSANVAFTQEYDTIEHALVATSAPEIAAFIRDMWAILERPPQPGLIEISSTKHPITGQRSEVRVTNFTAIQAYLERVREAVHDAEQMRLEPDQSTVPDRLSALRASLPKI